MRDENQPHIVAVTGGANGIGREVSLVLAEAHHDVIVFDLPGQKEQATAVVEAIETMGRRSIFVPMDVRDIQSINVALDQGVDSLGEPARWVNSAGVVNRRSALEISSDEWKQVLEVNLSGSFFCCQAFARHLITNHKPGSIVNVSSIFGLVGGPNRVAYSASKAAIVNFTRVLAYEWYDYGIRVNAVAPTFVQTPLTNDLLTRGLDITNRSLQGSLASSRDVAEGIKFLLSDMSKSITGHTLPIDRGWTSW